MTYLFEYGAKKIYLCSRTLAHAKELLAVHENLTVVDYHERYDVMKQCETVVSATSSPHLVVLYDKWKEMGVRQMQFLDLASPRDIDSRLQEVPGVQLIDMDTLQKITEKIRMSGKNWRQTVNRLLKKRCRRRWNGFY